METLPPEVYSQILSLARPTRPKRTPRHILPLEITLSHVSSGWRSLALSDSKSWELVEIFSPKTLPRGAAYVERSAGAAIYVRIDIYDYEYNHGLVRPRGHEALVAGLEEVLRTAAPRCKTLLILTYYAQTAERLAAALDNIEAPLLQRLRINTTVHDVDLQSPREDGRTLGTAAPATEESDIAKKIHFPIFSGGVSSLYFAELEVPFFPPLSGLVTLHIHNTRLTWLTFDTFAQIISQASSLENLSISPGYYTSAHWPVHRDAPRITLPSLRALRIDDDESPGMSWRILLSLATPNLISLSLLSTSTGFNTLFEAPQIQASIGARWPKLEYLVLHENNLQEMTGWAKMFPTIKYLHLPRLMGYYFKRFARDILLPTATGESLWPELRVLVFGTAKDQYSKTVQDGLCSIATERKARGLPVPKIMGDREFIASMKTSDLVNEVTETEVVDVNNYREPWWVMNHEETMDKIGLA